MARRNSRNRVFNFIHFRPERFSGFGVIYSGRANGMRTCAMPGRPIKLPSEGTMSSMRLGITVTGLYGAVAMGLMIVFLRGPS